MSRLQDALSQARDTRELVLRRGAMEETATAFARHFKNASAVVVADANTMRLAGEQVVDSIPKCDRLVFDDPDLYAHWNYIEQLEAALVAKSASAVPIAVGSGTINDLTKLVAHRMNRPYMCVATAASMDGYTAYGASITKDGAKQTFDCPAPRVVIADLDLIAGAPREMTASGYADLLAKVTAGADWIVADALGVEPINSTAWDIVQTGLRDALSDPAGCARGEIEPISRLIEGLMTSGFAMQAALSSRVASGAEHQFSHLWDMQHHAINGVAPSHGFKVGIGTLAVTRMYEDLLEQPIDTLDTERAASHWPAWESVERSIAELFPDELVRQTAIKESRAKYVEPDALREQLQHLRIVWPGLKTRLREQLIPSRQVEQMLSDAGAATQPSQIGISTYRLRDSFRLALHIRRRFTVLDLVDRAGLWQDTMGRLFPGDDE